MKLPVTRSGHLISQYSFVTRGYVRKKALAPILFVFAKDEMTREGQTIFEDVGETLKTPGLTGHHRRWPHRSRRLPRVQHAVVPAPRCRGPAGVAVEELRGTRDDTGHGRGATVRVR